MSNNTWGVPYSLISFLESLLQKHQNVKSVVREKDIYFKVARKSQGDEISILCLNEYTMSYTKMLKAIREFGDIDIFYIGGNWNGYTRQSKSFALQEEIGLFVTSEISGALYLNDYWSFHKKDRDNNPDYFYREE